MVTNVGTGVTQLYPFASNEGIKIGYFKGVSKAAQNDTITLAGITTLYGILSLDNASPAAETNSYTAAGVITCSSATGSTTISGVVLYK